MSRSTSFPRKIFQSPYDKQHPRNGQNCRVVHEPTSYEFGIEPSIVQFDDGAQEHAFPLELAAA